MSWPMLEQLCLVRQGNGGWRSAIDPGEPEHGKAGRWSVTDEEGKILSELARDKRVLEVGTGLGVSTCYLASAASSVDTIDIDPWVHQHVWPLLTPLGNVRPMATWPHRDEQYDLIFIDGLHFFDAVMQDIKCARSRLTADGMLVFHDFKYYAVREAVTRSGLRSEKEYSTANCIGVMRAPA